jgi:hypothetical protein
MTRVPRDIPLFLALAAGLGIAAYGFTELHMTARPSSTSGLAYLFIPFWSFVVAGAAFLLGLVVRAGWKRFFPEQQDSKRFWWVLPSLLGLILVAASSLGRFHAIETEIAAQPAVLVDAGRLERAFVPNADIRIREGKLLYKYDKTPEYIVWGANTSELLVGDDQVQVRDRAGSRKVVISTAVLDYITQAHAVPIVLAQYTQPGLAVVIAGRATGRRAIVLVLAPDYQVLLEERLYRFWELQSPAVEVRADQATKGEAIVVGPGCEKSLVIRSRKAV